MDPIEQAESDLRDAQCELEEANEAGDLESRLAASQAVEEAERRLMRARIGDQGFA